MAQAGPMQMSTAQLRTLQIIVGALAFGPTMFLVIVFAIRGGAERDADAQSLVTYVGIGVTVMALAARMFITGSAMTANMRRALTAKRSRDEPPHQATPDEIQTLWGTFQAQTIVGAALTEGPAFFMIIAYMLEQTTLSLVLAALLILGVLLHFPTAGKFQRWSETQLELLAHHV